MCTVRISLPLSMPSTGASRPALRASPILANDRLNYHHLLYLWTVGPRGRNLESRREAAAVAADNQRAESACSRTRSDQKLFQRQGRSLVMTDVGRVVYRYADEIFGIGRELLETLRGRPAGRPLQLAIGVANAVPKLIAYRLLRPAVESPEPVYIVCREDNAEQLTTQLATHALDVVIADTPAPPHVRVRVFNHLLGEWTPPSSHRRRSRRGCGGASPFAERRAAAPAHRQRGLAPLLSTSRWKGAACVPVSLVSSRIRR